MYTADMMPVDLMGLMNDCRELRSKHGQAMAKLEGMRHATLVHKMGGKADSWKQRIMRAANYFPRKPCFPYGEQAIKG